MESPPPPGTTRAPDSAIASAVKAGTVGYLVAKLSEAIVQAKVLPALLPELAGADPATLDAVRVTAPLVAGGLALGAVSFLGTAARDLAFQANSRLAKLVGKVAP